MSTLSGEALSGLHNQTIRDLGPQLQDVLGTKDTIDSVLRDLGPQLQHMLGTTDLIEQVDWGAVLSSPEIQQMLDAAPRVLVPPSSEVQKMMDGAVGTLLSGVEQPTSTEDSVTPIKLHAPDFVVQPHSPLKSSADVIAARTLLFTIVGVIVAILTLIVSVVVAAHDWPAATKTTGPVSNQTTNVTNNETTIDVTNLPSTPPFCVPPRQ